MSDSMIMELSIIVVKSNFSLGKIVDCLIWMKSYEVHILLFEAVSVSIHCSLKK